MLEPGPPVTLLRYWYPSKNRIHRPTVRILKPWLRQLPRKAELIRNMTRLNFNYDKLMQSKTYSGLVSFIMLHKSRYRLHQMR